MLNTALPWVADRRSVEYPKSARRGTSARISVTGPLGLTDSTSPLRALRSR